MPFQGFYTTKEVTSLLRVNNLTLMRWVRKGLLHRHRVGNMAFYRVSDVEEFLEKNTEV